MKYYRDSFFLNITSIIRNIYGLVRGKVTAILMGVKGVGILGQINAFFALQGQITNLGFNTILVNRLGKLDIDKDRNAYLQILLFTLIVIFSANFILLSFFILFKNEFSLILFSDNKYSNLFLLLVFLGPIFALSNIFETISQVRKNFSQLNLGRNIGSIIGIISFYPLIYFYSYYGIIISFYFFVFSSGIYFFRKNFDLLKELSFKHLKGIKSKSGFLLKFSIIDITRRIAVFSSFLFLRIIIVHFIGLEKNGLFQSIWSISFYPEIFLGAFAAIYYPLISEVSGRKIQEVMERNYDYLLLILFPFIALIMLIPDLLLRLLYSNEFLNMTSLLKILVFFQLIQSIYFFFNITFLGQTYLKIFLFSELCRSFVLVLSGYLLVPILEIKGAVISIIIMNIFSILLTLLFIYKYPIFRLPSKYFIRSIKFHIPLLLLFVPIPPGIIWRLFQLAIFIITTLLFVNFKKYKLILFFK